jgi:N-acylneuraminate cytidylyltransferase
MNGLSLIAIIPARKGSKGIKNKNRVLLNGKPLICYSIEAALRSSYIDTVVVSSDDEEILNIAQSYNISFINRPKELSGDFITLEPVILNVLDFFSGYDYFMLLQPTTPLRTVDHIDKAVELLLNKKCNAVISVTQPEKSPLKSFVLNDDGYLEGIRNNSYPFMSRQELPECFNPNGAIYLCDANHFKTDKTFLLKNTIPFVMDVDSSIDIDTMDDLKTVRNHLKKNENIF